MLDLVYKSHRTHYQAPLQLKSRRRSLIVDDLAASPNAPQAWSNRWDRATGRKTKDISWLLQSGEKFEVPLRHAGGVFRQLSPNEKSLNQAPWPDLFKIKIVAI